MPSDWYSENVLVPVTKDTKQTKHTARVSRGLRFAVSSREARSPTQHRAMSMLLPGETHSNVGAYHQCSRPG